MIKDIMIDIETLATSPDSVILTIAGIKFDVTKTYDNVSDPFSLDYFYCRVDTESQEKRFIDENTLAWWAQQAEDVRAEAFDPTDRLPVADAMTAFNYWAQNTERYWANGAAFDFPILETMNKQLGFESPWLYWQAMDARTIYKIVPEVVRPKPNLHHALHDCLNQIQKLTACLKFLKRI
jgi:3' exoribonuclease, RNase T-like